MGGRWGCQCDDDCPKRQPSYVSYESEEMLLDHLPQRMSSRFLCMRLEERCDEQVLSRSNRCDPRALEAIEEAGQTPDFFLDKHAQGDWGEVSNGDKKLNDEALVDGERLLSAYRTLKNERIWVITEADRSSTCLLKPSEY